MWKATARKILVPPDKGFRLLWWSLGILGFVIAAVWLALHFLRK